MNLSQQFADNEDIQSEWREAKRRNKIKVASFLKEKTGYLVNPDAMFDVQVILCLSNICSVLLAKMNQFLAHKNFIEVNVLAKMKQFL